MSNAGSLIDPRGRVLWVHSRLPKTLPEGWETIHLGGVGAAYLRNDGLQVIVSGRRERDGKRWLHISCARTDRLPTWKEFGEVKDLFVGPDEYAVQVLPPQRFSVNFHPFTLHLFSCVDGHPLPEFSRDGRL